MADFEQLVDLASERLGGSALWATDDFFAPKENLLRAAPAVFVPDRYTERGKWMDGWESRRRRVSGHDWCLIRLGLAGVIRGVDVDTSHFLGNAPQACSLDAQHHQSYQLTESLIPDETSWTEILPRTPVKPGAHNLLSISGDETWSHVRLHIYPDGGVARLRLYGDVTPNWEQILGERRLVDLAGLENGGSVLSASDELFSGRQNLIMPGRSQSMSDGWETRRRRGPGHDWAVLKLGRPGKLIRVEVDTTHFKGNFPESCSLEGGFAARGSSLPEQWREILPQTKLQAHSSHIFESELVDVGPISHARLNIFPDGGVARLRLFGEPMPMR